MPRNNVEVVEDCFRAWDRRDLDGVLDNYASDAEFDATRVMEGVYRGRDAIREHYRSIFESFVFVNDELELLPAGDDLVIVLTRIRGVGVSSEAAVEAPFAYEFTIREGRVSRVCLYPEPAEALEAAGLRG